MSRRSTPDLFRLDGRVAVITGAGRGIGAAAAIALAGLVASARERFGRLDVVVDNLGATAPDPDLEAAPEDLEAAFARNV